MLAVATVIAILASGGWGAGAPAAGGLSASTSGSPVLPASPPEVDATARAPEQAVREAGPAVDRVPATPPPVEEVDPPVRVVLDGAGIDAEVVPVGVADDGQMELPDHPDVVGWYRHGAGVGGGAGSVVLSGHVDSLRYGLGQLARLRETEVGDRVVVETAAGGSVAYTVVDVSSTPKPDLPLVEIFDKDGAERLVLISCDGEFDPNRGSYEDNIVVTAVP